MANYTNLLSTIAANVYANGNQEITADMVKAALNSMVSSLGAGYQYMGVATTSTNPNSPDQKGFYIATEVGTYTNFNLSVSDGEVAIFYGSGTSWSKKVTGIASAAELTELGQKVDALALGKFYGFYTTSGDLPAGDEVGFAYVGASSPFAIYNFDGNTWSDSGSVYTYPLGNGEDIDLNEDGELQFANRGNTDGMGYIIMRKDDTFVNQLTDSDTIYEIRYDFDLGGASVTIPSGCVLKFVGGSLSNGEVNLNGAYISGGSFDIFRSLTLNGSIGNATACADWYAADNGDDTIRITELQKVAGEIVFGDRDYYVNATLSKKVSLTGVRGITRFRSFLSAPGSVILDLDFEDTSVCNIKNIVFVGNSLAQSDIIGAQFTNRGSQTNFLYCEFRRLRIGIYKPFAGLSSLYLKNRFVNCDYGLYFIGTNTMHCGDDLVLFNDFSIISKFCAVVIGGTATGGKWIFSQNEFQSSSGGIYVADITNTIIPGVVIENNWFESISSDSDIAFDDYKTNTVRTIPSSSIYVTDSVAVEISGARVETVNFVNSNVVVERFGSYTTQSAAQNFKSIINITTSGGRSILRNYIGKTTDNLGKYYIDNILIPGNWLVFRRNYSCFVRESKGLLFDAPCIARYGIRKDTTGGNTTIYPTISSGGFISDRCCYYDFDNSGEYSLIRYVNPTPPRYLVIKMNIKFTELVELTGFVDEIIRPVYNRCMLHKEDIVLNEWASYAFFIDTTHTEGSLSPFRFRMPCLSGNFTSKFYLSGLQLFGFDSIADAMNELNSNDYCIQPSTFVKRGATAQRPNAGDDSFLTPSDIGYEYFDETIHKPIYASAIDSVTGVVSWVDATGASV